ncbi:MAG: pyruvate flavodoxin/ferredoxin oxidoreductase [Nitrospinota bacterium]|nr:MAG: pyruvate flavodoxin/ferredoxin oxidoreductase [Nitrospinota bacterium]
MRKMAIRSGNQMVVEGALAAGCRFFSGYPITPASSIYQLMTEKLPAQGDVAISAPDEISVLCYCVGASMRGFKAMTATSGPGWCLMSETVQYAIMTETPVVIVLVQRLGPSTGGATQGAQGDILLTEFVTSGGYTIPVFCPSNPLECYELTIHAFNWAETLRTPVVLLSDKEVGMTAESIDLSALPSIPIIERKLFTPANGEEFIPYFFHKPEEVPPFSPVGGRYKVTLTGSAHNKLGRLKKNDPETLEVLTHLQQKIVSRTAEMTMVKADLQPGAQTLIISFGITARSAKEATRMAQKEGRTVSFLQLLTLFPIPEQAILQAAKDAECIVIAEENLTGQYRSLIRHLFAGKEVLGVNKIGGMISPAEILSVLPS